MGSYVDVVLSRERGKWLESNKRPRRADAKEVVDRLRHKELLSIEGEGRGCIENGKSAVASKQDWLRISSDGNRCQRSLVEKRKVGGCQFVCDPRFAQDRGENAANHGLVVPRDRADLVGFAVLGYGQSKGASSKIRAVCFFMEPLED